MTAARFTPKPTPTDPLEQVVADAIKAFRANRPSDQRMRMVKFWAGEFAAAVRAEERRAA